MAGSTSPSMRWGACEGMGAKTTGSARCGRGKRGDCAERNGRDVCDSGALTTASHDPGWGRGFVACGGLTVALHLR